MTLGKPKNWGELLAMLGVLSLVVSAAVMLADIRQLILENNQQTQENHEMLTERGELIDQFNASFDGLHASFDSVRELLEDLQRDIDDNLLDVIMVNEKQGFILQRLPEKHGGKMITIKFNKYPPEEIEP